jgi:phage terminase small subunit
MPVLKNVRHELFVQARARGLQPAEAYLAAGFPNINPKWVRQPAYKLNKQPDIQDRLAEILSKPAEEAGITALGILLQLKQIGYANMQDYITVDSDGVARINLRNLTRDQAAAIQKVRTKETETKFGTVTEVHLELHDKVGALVKLGDHLGIFKQKIEVTGANGGPVQLASIATIEEAAQAYAKLLSEG